MNNNNNRNRLDKINAKLASLRESIRPIKEQIDELEKEQEDIVEKIEMDILESNSKIFTEFKLAGAVDIFAEIDNLGTERSANEDDGTLHITIGNIRGCFISDQDITKSEWNRLARPILKRFGFSIKDINN